jgi:hypothetical protein
MTQIAILADLAFVITYVPAIVATKATMVGFMTALCCYFN